jgi:hypothetical protein
MRITSASTLLRNAIFTAAFAFLLLLAPERATQAADANPFDLLLGSWGGSGTFNLNDGSSERIQCNAYYTGGGNQLGMAIRCKSSSSNIEIRSKLNKSGNRISGSWEERTYNAGGSASGSATGSRISLQISGGVTGQMTVSYSKTRQTVSISTQGIPLRSVNITLSRS